MNIEKDCNNISYDRQHSSQRHQTTEGTQFKFLVINSVNRNFNFDFKKETLKKETLKKL